MGKSSPERPKLLAVSTVAAQQEEISTTPVANPAPKQPDQARPIYRPSFASPTRASLERHNPQIAQRLFGSASRKPRRRDSAPLSASRLTAHDGNTMATDVSGTRINVPVNSDGGSRRGDGSSSSSARRLGVAFAAKPRRSLARPSPRPLPPPGPDEDEDVLNQFRGQGLRRSRASGGVCRSPEPEPELPPRQDLDPIVSTPASGIHTPSGRAKRSQELLTRMRSSPQKQALVKFPLEKATGRAEKPKPQTGNVLRGIEADSQKELECMLAENSHLERDLQTIRAEMERQRQIFLAKEKPCPAPNQLEIDDIFERRGELWRDAPDPPPWPARTQAALDSMACLPFSKASSSLPDVFRDSKAIPGDEKAPIQTHAPLVLTAEEELPFLRLFTPLTFTSRVFPLPGDDDPKGADATPRLERRHVTATSASPPGFFAAQIEMTYDTRTKKMTDLAVPRLEPAALAELGAFINTLVKPEPAVGDAFSRAKTRNMKRNMVVLAWAMGSWFRMAMRRARAWQVLKRDLETKENLARTVAGRRRPTKRKRRSHGGRWGRGDESEGGEGDGETNGAVKQDRQAVASNQLHAHMGRTAMDFKVPWLAGGGDGDEDMTGADLRVQWTIEFDWTGEALSRIGVLVGVPERWHQDDRQGRISRLPHIFDDLIQAGQSPVFAVKTIVALLAGDTGSL